MADSIFSNMFDNPETKTNQKQKTVQQLSPFTQALQTLIARFALMRLNQMQGQTFGDWRQNGPMVTPLSVLPQEAAALPGTSDTVPGVNPILTRYSMTVRK